MSVKLVIVALLAAAVATASAKGIAANITVLECNSAAPQEANCNCTPEGKANSQNFSTVCPKEHDDDFIFYKADSCPSDSDEEGIVVVKGYKEAGCAVKTIENDVCSSLFHTKAVCDDDGVTLEVGCPDNTCRNCKSTYMFTFSEAACIPFEDDVYYKLATSTCPNDADEGVPFTIHTTNSCSDRGKPITIPKDQCFNTMQKLSCSPASGGNEGEVVFETCFTQDCSGSCSPRNKLPLGKYKELENDVYYIEKCPAAGAKYKFEIYSAVWEFQMGCHGDRKVTCTPVPSSDDDNDNDNNNNNSNNNSNDNNDNDNNSTTDDATPSFVSAHSVGVSALLVGLLACMF